MKKMISRSLGIVMLFLLFSCHLFDDNTSIETVAVFFNETNVSVYEGGLASVSLRVEPPDVLEYNNVSYSISNEEIAVIYRADKRGCVFTGRSEGSTVLLARIKDAEAKMVITVLK
jgi:hypothetical protein